MQTKLALRGGGGSASSGGASSGSRWSLSEALATMIESDDLDGWPEHDSPAAGSTCGPPAAPAPADGPPVSAD